MENEKTYEQWEIEVKQKIADMNQRELLSAAEGVVIQLLHSLWAMRSHVETDNEEDDYYENDLRRRIAETAVVLDALQLRFGDVAEQEFAFLQTVDRIFE